VNAARPGVALVPLAIDMISFVLTDMDSNSPVCAWSRLIWFCNYTTKNFTSLWFIVLLCHCARALVFTARLHVMQRTVLPRHFCPSVRPSVCLSNAFIVTKRKETSAHILTQHERTIIIVFRHKDGLEGATTYTWNFRPNWSNLNKNADFQSIFARSASAVTPREKVQLSLIRINYARA